MGKAKNPQKKVVQVSSKGNIRYANGKVTIPKANSSAGGYCRVKISGKNYFVHRLVALAFLDPPKAGQVTVDHKNLIRSDNRVENLQWASHQEQIVSSHQNNVNRGSCAQAASRAIVGRKVGSSDDEWTEYPSAHEAAHVLELNRSSISQCCSGKRKTTGSYQFKFVQEVIDEEEEWKDVVLEMDVVLEGGEASPLRMGNIQEAALELEVLRQSRNEHDQFVPAIEILSARANP